MKYCPNCGAEIAEGNQFCHSCGEKLSNSQPQPQYQPQYQTTQDYTYQEPEKKASIKNAIISFILGLINIELAICCFIPYSCFIIFPGCILLSVFGLILSKK